MNSPPAADDFCSYCLGALPSDQPAACPVCAHTHTGETPPEFLTGAQLREYTLKTSTLAEEIPPGSARYTAPRPAAASAWGRLRGVAWTG